ncbi:MAG: YIP1 family protein [Halapricum sp.]
MALRQLLVDPGGFFAVERDSWIGGVAVLTLCALSLASLLVPVVILVGTTKSLGVAESFPAVSYVAGGTQVGLSGRSLGVVAIVVFAPIPVLAGYTVLFHLLSWPVASRGSILDTARVTAWGAVALSVANAVTLLGTVASFPQTFDELGYAYVTLTGRTIVQRSDPSVLLLAVNLLGLACVCWAAVVWLRGIEQVRGCSPRQAAVIVGGPVAIAVGVNAPSLLYGFL